MWIWPLKRNAHAGAAPAGRVCTTVRDPAAAGLTERNGTPPAPRLLTVARRSWLRRDLEISDEAGAVLYTASRRAGFPTSVWTLRKGGRNVATLRRKALSPMRTCVVTFKGSEFVLRKKLSISWVTEACGGPFDGAIFSGSLTGRDFRLEHAGRLIAEVKAEILSTRGRHEVRVIAKDEPLAEPLTALMVLDLLIKKEGDG